MRGHGAPALDLLVLADLHYVAHAAHACPVPARKARFALEAAERAVRRALREAEPDAIVLLGDLVDNGMADGADDDLIALRDKLRPYGVPILVVPGNHDGEADRLMGIFGNAPGPHHLGGCQVVTIVAPYEAGDVTRHPDDALALVTQAAADAPDKPLVVLQHNPVHPAIESTYPYNPANAEAVMRCYADAGVVLSLSGHYHPGIPPETVGGVCYATAPALCEAPFRFLRVRLRGRDVEVRDLALAMSAGEADDLPQPLPRSGAGGGKSKTTTTTRTMRGALWDIHCHTHYAYCRDDVTATGAIERARLLGLGGIVLTEHAGQLYLDGEHFWGGRFFDDPDLIRRHRHTPMCRMDAYLAEVLPLRSDFVRLGLECDGDGRGGLTLLDEDRGHWDLLVGAVHWITGLDPASATDAELRRRFMAASESVALAGVDVLAHPFRYFRRGKVDAPRELYRPMARLLAAAGVAAEINFHTHQPDPRFIAACLDEGVRIALATDSHALWEVGELAPHLDVLRQAGCQERDWPAVLFLP